MLVGEFLRYVVQRLCAQEGVGGCKLLLSWTVMNLTGGESCVAIQLTLSNATEDLVEDFLVGDSLR